MSTVIQFPDRSAKPLVDVVNGEIKALMGRHDVSQERLAEWLSLPQTAVSKRLRGAVRWNLVEVELVAEAFGVHPAALMGGYATGPQPDPDGGIPIVRACRDSNPKPSDPKVLPYPLCA